jgi:nitroreductase
MILDVMRARRSVRRFRSDPVPAALVEGLIEAAVTAPSASNKQPWRFLVVTRRSAIDAMAAAVRDALARIEQAIPPESRDALRAYGDYFTRFEGAPCVIVPLHRGAAVLSNLVDAGGGLPAEERAAIAAMERDSGLVGASLALQNLLLAAHDAGLGASAMTGPLVAAPRLAEILDVPPSWGIVALVPIGFPAETPAPPGRKPSSKVTRWIA